MKSIRKLALLMAVVSAVGSGMARADEEGERRGSNAAAGSASTASTQQDVQSFFREMERALQQPGASEGAERHEPAVRNAPQSSRNPGTGPRADSSRQGPNIAGDATSAGALAAPGGPARGRQGAGEGAPGVAPQCPRCVAI